MLRLRFWFGRKLTAVVEGFKSKIKNQKSKISRASL
jgi:hypothetical protein